MRFSPIFASWIDDVMEFTTQWYFWVPLILVLLLLIGIFVFMRMRKQDD
jgi:hypothetical protein